MICNYRVICMTQSDGQTFFESMLFGFSAPPSVENTFFLVKIEVNSKKQFLRKKKKHYANFCSWVKRTLKNLRNELCSGCVDAKPLAEILSLWLVCKRLSHLMFFSKTESFVFWHIEVKMHKNANKGVYRKQYKKKYT